MDESDEPLSKEALQELRAFLEGKSLAFLQHYYQEMWARCEMRFYQPPPAPCVQKLAQIYRALRRAKEQEKREKKRY